MQLSALICKPILFHQPEFNIVFRFSVSGIFAKHYRFLGFGFAIIMAVVEQQGFAGINGCYGIFTYRNVFYHKSSGNIFHIPFNRCRCASIYQHTFFGCKHEFHFVHLHIGTKSIQIGVCAIVSDSFRAFAAKCPGKISGNWMISGKRFIR